jgi:hypothetical protein
MRDSFLYFAFGSNMLNARLKRRCNSARVVTTAQARGYRVAFDKLSEDTSGKANLVRSDSAPSANGVVYEISSADAQGLDAIEGPGYRRKDGFPVMCLRTGGELRTITYTACEKVAGLQPYDWYLALVLAGLAEHGIDAAYARALRGTRYIPDPQRDRVTRHNALRDLRAAGQPDYNSLLRAPA